jgi:hypothetical protein
VTSTESGTQTEDESPHVHRFRTHAAYLRALRHLALGDSPRLFDQGNPSKLIDHGLPDLIIRATHQVANGTPGQDVDYKEVLACLNRAWGTELILATTTELASSSDVVGLANSWGSVQAYYAIYGVAQAVLVAEGHRRPDNHQGTQRAFVDLWVSRRISLAPWSFAAAAVGTRLADADGYLGGPSRKLDLTLHPWSSWGGDTCWDVSALALRGTRLNHLQEQRDAARERKRVQRRREFSAKQKERQSAGKRLLKQPAWWESTPQLTKSEKMDLDSRLRPITLLDHLFRLRIRANYEDALMFSQGPETEWAARLWAANLVALTSASLLVHELRLTHLLGAPFMRKAADGWLERHRSALPAGLILRRPMWL